jgi:hypothetical protein
MDSIVGSYKYNPDDFIGILGLPSELADFYRLCEAYKSEKSNDKWLPLRKHWEDLFFTIKHREVEGVLTSMDAQGIRDYLEVLVND